MSKGKSRIPKKNRSTKTHYDYNDLTGNKRSEQVHVVKADQGMRWMVGAVR